MWDPPPIRPNGPVTWIRFVKSTVWFFLGWAIQAILETQFNTRFLVRLDSDAVRQEIFLLNLVLFAYVVAIVFISVGITLWVLLINDLMYRHHKSLRLLFASCVTLFFIMYLILGPSSEIDPYLERKDELHGMSSQHSAATQAYVGVPKNQPIEYARIPVQNMFLIDRDEKTLTLRDATNTILSNPLVCATLYNPLPIGEGNAFEYGFTVSTPGRENRQYISITGDGRLGSRVNLTSHVTGFIYPFPDNVVITWESGIGMNMCLLVQEDYLHLFVDDALIMTWPNELHWPQVRVGFYYNFEEELSNNVPPLEVRDIRVLATEDSEVINDAEIETGVVEIGSPVP